MLLTGHDRLQVPKSELFFHRFFYRVEVHPLPNGNASQCVCQLPHKMAAQWVTLGDIIEQMAYLAGAEPKVTFEHYIEDIESRPRNSRSQTKLSTRKTTNLERFSLEHSMDDETKDFAEGAGPKWQLLQCAGFAWFEVKSLANEFRLHCYPSHSMTQVSLGRFLKTKLAVGELTEAKLAMLFK